MLGACAHRDVQLSLVSISVSLCELQPIAPRSSIGVSKMIQKSGSVQRKAIRTPRPCPVGTDWPENHPMLAEISILSPSTAYCRNSLRRGAVLNLSIWMPWEELARLPLGTPYPSQMWPSDRRRVLTVTPNFPVYPARISLGTTTSHRHGDPTEISSKSKVFLESHTQNHQDP